MIELTKENLLYLIERLDGNVIKDIHNYIIIRSCGQDTETIRAVLNRLGCTGKRVPPINLICMDNIPEVYTKWILPEMQ